MQSLVIDTSILFTIIKKEPGHEIAIDLLPYSVMSSVNIAETIGILMSRHDMNKEQILSIIKQLVDTIVIFNEKQAIIAGELEVINRKNNYGLSLADRFCIALGIDLKLPIYTTDKVWEKLNGTSAANIKLIR